MFAYHFDIYLSKYSARLYYKTLSLSKRKAICYEKCVCPFVLHFEIISLALAIDSREKNVKRAKFLAGLISVKSEVKASEEGCRLILHLLLDSSRLK